VCCVGDKIYEQHEQHQTVSTVATYQIFAAFVQHIPENTRPTKKLHAFHTMSLSDFFHRRSFVVHGCRQSATELFKSPLRVSGTNCSATSRLYDTYEFSAVVSRLMSSTAPSLTSCSACELTCQYRTLFNRSCTYILLPISIDMRTGPFKTCLWLLLTVAMLAGLTYSLTGITTKYLSYPSTVGITIEHSIDIQFPAITLCNLSPVRASRYNELVLHAAPSRRRRRSTDEGILCTAFCAHS